MSTGALRASSAVALTAAAVVGSLLVTVAVSALPFLRYAYEAPALHVVLETANSFIALLVGLLVLGRFRRSGRLHELLLVCSLAVVAVANLVLTAIPTALELSGEGSLSDWAPLIVRLVATVLLAAAALTPASVVLRRHTAAPAVVALVLVVTVLCVGALLLGDELPPAVDPGELPATAGQPTVVGHPGVLAVQGVGVLLYAAAAAAFTLRAARTGDELLRWVGAGCVLAAFARVNYLLFPSLYSDFVYAGDLLRFGYYLMLLTGAVREIRSYWSAAAQAAVLEDRRRLARDLHDGLTQELSYIWSQSLRLSGAPGDVQAVERINSAAARALDEARSAIAALTRTADEGFAAVLEQTADGLASRYDARVEVDVDPRVELTPAQGDAVLRIVAEAFRNAVLHGRASCVRVTLAAAPLRLTVRDDGQGFALPVSKTGGGFGLTSMRERAEGLGAHFALSSTPAGGTTVMVSWL